MNLFLLDLDTELCAQYHCDPHVCKMILETAQLLYCAHHMLGSALPQGAYRKTHANHPCAKWVRETGGNYLFACHLGLALCREFKHRFEKTHKTQSHLQWLLDHVPHSLQPSIQRTTPPTQSFSKGFPHLVVPVSPNSDGFREAVQGYRKYYAMGKQHLLKYRKRDLPPFLA